MTQSFLSAPELSTDSLSKSYLTNISLSEVDYGNDSCLQKTQANIRVRAKYSTVNIDMGAYV